MIAHPQYILAILLLAASFVAAIFWMIPEWSRPGIYFAVTVPPEFRKTPEALSLLRSYRIHALLHVAIGFALIFAAIPRHWSLLIVGEIWLAIGPLVAFLRARERVMHRAVVPVSVREAVLAPRAAHLPGGWILQLGPFVVLLVTAIYLRLHWDQIPDRFPVHWGIDGQPNGWSVRTPMGVFGPLLGAFGLVAGLSLLTYAMLHHARVVRVPGSKTTRYDFAHRIGLLLVAVEFFVASTFSLAGLLPLIGNPGVAPIFVLTILMLAVVFALAGWVNRGRARDLTPVSLAAGTSLGDGTRDQDWKAGMFYYNPNDAALFVEARVGVGYTINFGHASAWIIMAVVLIGMLMPLLIALSAVKPH
jgi:uncharacterized membrane protein